MKKLLWVLLLFAGAGTYGWAQNLAAQNSDSQATLRVTSRAVLVDVIVTDKDGKPVKGLKQDAFTVTEQGKPQTITFFEEHHAAEPMQATAAPKLPQNVFSNYSAYPLPPAVNVVLLDSLNTTMSSQSWVHSQALKFLRNTKPGTQAAIFTMGLGFHFIQGFTSDPTVLIAALNNKKNNEVEQSVMLKSQEESNAQQNLIGMMSEAAPGGGSASITVASPGSILALGSFFTETDASQGFDRFFLTLDNLQRLATFLNSFPGRKNVIWFAESVPGFLLVPGSQQLQMNPRLDEQVKKTMAMLAAARVALYPVDARGLTTNSLYDAQTVLPKVSEPSQLIGPPAAVAYGGTSGGAFSNSMNLEDQGRNTDQQNMKFLAEQTGGRAFFNTNGLGQVINEITSGSSDFYTLSYAPTNEKMDGSFRTIDVKVEGGRYNLSYRRGYFAVDEGLPGEAIETREQALHNLQQKNGGAVDPLLPFMDLGMPPSNQILYEQKVQPLSPNASGPDAGKLRYGVDFAIDQKDLKLHLDPDGIHRGVLNITLLVYDRYGKIVGHWEHLAALAIKPDVYAVFQNTGVQLHADIATPKGNYWLRTGIYDQNSHKVGTLEIPLAAVKPVEAAAAVQH